MVFPRLYRLARALLPTLAGLLLLACGGGVDSGGTGSAYVYSSIDGFGSIIVGETRFDDGTADVRNDDGEVLRRDQLRLGMMVEVDGTASTAANGDKSGVATTIRVASAIIGPIDGGDPNMGTITVLGQPVHITPATVFHPLFSGFDNMLTGTVVEVYGQFDRARGRFVATRIEPKPAAAFYKLRGPISAMDASAKTLLVGGQTISYAQLAPADLPTLAVGGVVRARLELTANNGVWTASVLRSGVIALPDRQESTVEGRISNWTSSREFNIDSIQIDARNASFVGGEGAVVLGARVQVEGSSSGGVLLARVVTVEGDEVPSNSMFELHGAVAALDSAALTFEVQGVVVSYGGTVLFESGTVAELANGRNVKVVGILSSDGTVVEAQTITYE